MIGQNLREDVASLFTGRSIDELAGNITSNLARVTLEKDQARDGSLVEEITLFLKPAALLDSVMGVDPRNPVLLIYFFGT